MSAPDDLSGAGPGGGGDGGGPDALTMDVREAGSAVKAYVALGSNLGDSAAELRAAASMLARTCASLRRSSLYRTEPVGGPAGQPEFLNAVVELVEPRLGPRALLQALLAIEDQRGRVRRERWGPRVIDLDLLAYGAVMIDDPGLSLPHPRLHHRAFVLAPLCELAPGWRLPDTGETACALLGRLPRGGIERTDIPW